MIKLKNILLGILVVALASLIVSSVSATTPTAAGGIIPTDEDTTYAFKLADFDSSFADADGDTFKAIQITQLESVGDLKYNNQDVTAGQNISKEDIYAGKLIFVPKANEHGVNYDSFKFKVIDSADEISAAEYDISITVNAINDLPTFSAWDFSSIILKEETAFTFDVDATDVDVGDILTYSWTVSPALISLTIDPVTGIISGTPVNSDEGVYTATLNVADGGLEEVTQAVEFYINDRYDDGVLTLDVNFDDLTGDDDRHYPGDIIEIEVEVDNDGGFNVQDLTVTIECDALDIDEEIDINEVDEDEAVTETIEIQIPYDAEDRTYRFDIRVIGQDDSDDEDYHSDVFFEGDLELIDLDVRRGNHDIIFESLKVTPSEVDAGNIVSIRAEVTNIGEKNEENVRITLKNTNLGLNEESTEFDLKVDKSKRITWDIELPKTTENGEYILEAVISYDDDSYDEEDTLLAQTVTIKVSGGSAVPDADADTTVGAATLDVTSASLVSANTGEAAKFELMLTNNAETTEIYQIRASGVNDWATYTIEAGGEANEVSLTPGTSLTIYAYLTPKDSAQTGQYTATISVYSNSQLLDSELLTVDVTAKQITTINTGIGSAISFRPTDTTIGWYVLGVVAMFGIVVAAITVYKIKKD